MLVQYNQTIEKNLKSKQLYSAMKCSSSVPRPSWEQIKNIFLKRDQWCLTLYMICFDAGTHPFPSPPFLLLHLSSSQPLSLRAAHFIRAPSKKQQQQQQQTIIHTQRTLCRGRSGQWHLREREGQTERGRESDSTWHTAPLWQRDFDWLAVWRRILEDNAALLILFTPFSASRLSSRRPLMVF